MFQKISLTAAFLLMVAPPIACASSRDAASRVPTTRPANQLSLGMMVAQDSESVGTSDSDHDNDNDSNDSDDDKQDSDASQTDQQDSAGNDQSIPPTVLGAPDTEPGETPQVPQTNTYPAPVNPYQ